MTKPDEHYLAIIESMDIAEAAALATEEILGDLSQPHTGIMSALPIEKTWGIPEPYTDD